MTNTHNLAAGMLPTNAAIWDIQHRPTTKSIDFNPDWENGTGYLDNLVDKDLGEPAGTILKSTDQHDREIIILVTPVGNIVVFQRFSFGALGAAVSNHPTAFKDLLPRGHWSADAIADVFDAWNNFNKIITRVYKAMHEKMQLNIN